MDSDIFTFRDNQGNTAAVTSLLKQLNVTRRMITLYPAEHPQIRTSTSRTLNILNHLWDQNRVLTLGIAPETIYVNNTRVEQQDPVCREFSRYFFHAGVASISFHKGLDAQELIRFHRLLHNKKEPAPAQESFSSLLEEHRIVNISVRLVDYGAFREKTAESVIDLNTDAQLWDDFLHRLLQDDMATSDYLGSEQQDTILALFNQKLSGTPLEQDQATQGIRHLLTFGSSGQQSPDSLKAYNKKLHMLLEKLTPKTRNDFLRKGLKSLESHDESSLKPALKRISPEFLDAMVTHADKSTTPISSRLLNLISTLSSGTEAQRASPAGSSSPEDIHTRLTILFKEEQIDLYLPEGYQQALDSAIDNDLSGTLTAEDRLALNDMINSQSVEEHTARIIFERLSSVPDNQLAIACQHHLLNFSRLFLEAGNYTALYSTFQHWSGFLNQRENPIDLLAEKLTAYHTQASFIAEVLDGFDLWQNDRHQEIINYIVLVGEPYCEPIVERLGLAHHFFERKRWIDLLTRISGNAQQKIIPFLTDERWYLVRNLVMILGAEPTPAVIKAIQPLHQHPHPQVRAEVIRLLFSCNQATANRLLLNELNSDNMDTCLIAVSIAHLSRDPEVLSFLHRQLDKDPTNDVELALAEGVVTALCHRGEKESLVVLRRLLTRGGLLLRRRSRQLQHHIIAALADFRHPAVDKLLQELQMGKFRREAAATMTKRRESL